MNPDSIKQPFNSDEEFEQMLDKAINKAGRERDSKLIDEMASMNREEFQALLADSASDASDANKAKRKRLQSVWIRGWVATAACVALIWGIAYMPMVNSVSPLCASMFSEYYHGDKVDWTTFDAGDDQLNRHGAKSTARILEDATTLLSKKNDRRSTRKAIEKLENLLNNDWRKTSLDPEIRWYLGLAYLKDGKIDKARSQFEVVRNMGRAHASEATELLADLNKK